MKININQLNIQHMKSGETKANINLRKTLRRKNNEKNRKFSEQKKLKKKQISMTLVI